MADLDETLAADIAAHNEKALGGDEGDGTPAPDPPPVAEPTGAAPAGDDPPPAAAAKEEEKTGEEGSEPDPPPAGGDPPAAAAAAPDAETAIEISNDLPLETFRERRTAILDQFEEVPPEITQVIDYYEHRLESVAAPETAFEELGGIERVTKTVAPFQQLARTSIQGAGGQERVVANAVPLVEMLRADYRNEFSTIAGEMLMSDSLRYRNMSVLQELMTDIFGCTPQQIMAVDNFLRYKTPLPAVKDTKLPPGVDEALAEAYLEMPERKRFELDELAKEIAQMEADMPTLDAYYKGEAEKKLTDLKGRLDDEIATLSRVQAGITATKKDQERTERQAIEDAARFHEELQTKYLGATAELSTMFAKDLAPKLDFVDAAAQPIVANSIIARFASALSFFYDAEFKYIPDPTAEFYRQQLKAEGVKYDFEEGSKLFYEHLLALRRLEVCTRTRQSPEVVKEAERDLKATLVKIKAGYTELTGQISKKVVDGAGRALDGKVAELAGKKQFARKVAAGYGSARQRGTEDTLDDERKAHNERVRRELAESEGGSYDDVLFDRQ